MERGAWSGGAGAADVVASRRESGNPDCGGVLKPGCEDGRRSACPRWLLDKDDHHSVLRELRPVAAVLTTLYRAQRFTVRVVAERTGVEYMALSTGKSRTQP